MCWVNPPLTDPYQKTSPFLLTRYPACTYSASSSEKKNMVKFDVLIHLQASICVMCLKTLIRSIIFEARLVKIKKANDFIYHLKNAHPNIKETIDKGVKFTYSLPTPSWKYISLIINPPLCFFHVKLHKEHNNFLDE